MANVKTEKPLVDPNALILQDAARSAAKLISFEQGSFLSRRDSDNERKLLVEEVLVKLKQLDIDPALWDRIVSNQVDRELKKKFGRVFILMAFFFTSLSYAVIIFNSILSWNIPETAMTALIIQAPLQLIGILLVMARNLFPEKGK